MIDFTNRYNLNDSYRICTLFLFHSYAKLLEYSSKILGLRKPSKNLKSSQVGFLENKNIF